MQKVGQSAYTVTKEKLRLGNVTFMITFSDSSMFVALTSSNDVTDDATKSKVDSVNKNFTPIFSLFFHFAVFIISLQQFVFCVFELCKIKINLNISQRAALRLSASAKKLTG